MLELFIIDHTGGLMLVITIDLVPGGYEPHRRCIGSMRIINASSLTNVSDYVVEATEAHNPLTGTRPRSVDCVVRGHHRAQSVWALVAKAAEEIMKTDPSNFSDRE
jgi:hypothetical protein